MKQACTALSVWNVVKDHLAFQVATVLFPESVDKGMAFFWTTKIFRAFFSIKIKLFFAGIDFQRITKSYFFAIF